MPEVSGLDICRYVRSSAALSGRLRDSPSHKPKRDLSPGRRPGSRSGRLSIETICTRGAARSGSGPRSVATAHRAGPARRARHSHTFGSRPRSIHCDWPRRQVLVRERRSRTRAQVAARNARRKANCDRGARIAHDQRRRVRPAALPTSASAIKPSSRPCDCSRARKTSASPSRCATSRRGAIKERGSSISTRWWRTISGRRSRACCSGRRSCNRENVASFRSTPSPTCTRWSATFALSLV